MHAAGESSPGNLPEGTHAIALVADDELALWRLDHVLRRAHVEHRLIIESEGPYAGQLLAIGVSPRRKEEVRRHVATFSLLR